MSATEDWVGLEALRRLFAVAGGDSGQARRVADFLLAWHSAEENGGWDPADLWAVDNAIADDMLTVVRLIRQSGGRYPNDLGFETDITAVWRQWRAHHPRLASAQEHKP
jgi:hypothetical protein